MAPLELVSNPVVAGNVLEVVEPGFELDELSGGCCDGVVWGDVVICVVVVATPASDINEDDVGVPPKELESLLLAEW